MRATYFSIFLAYLLSAWFIPTTRLIAQPAPADSVLTLARALELAAQTYPSIRGKRAEIEATRADLEARRASFLPAGAVQTQALYGTSNNVRGATFPNEGTTNNVASGIKPNGPTADAVWTSLGSLNVNWRAITFGRNKADLAVAQSAISRAEADYRQEMFVQQVRTADTYLMALILDQAVRVQQANLSRVQAFRQVMQANTRSGLRPGVDSALADAELAKARLLLLDSHRMAQQQRVLLGQLTGLPPSAQRLDTTTFRQPTMPILTYPANTLLSHPTLTYFQRQLDVDQAQILSIRKSILPALSLNGSFWARGSGIADNLSPEGNFVYNPSLGAGLPFRVANYFVGLSTVWRFTDWFRIRQETKAQTLRTLADQSRYDEQLLALRAQQQTADLQIQTAQEAARQSPVQLAAAQAAYGQAQARYGAGLANLYEFTQAFTLLNRAEIDQSVAINNVWRAYLLKAAAEGDMAPFLQLTTR
ncbi:outer membrane efflux protein (plasmid) [Fibrella aestuarina BUZ 2]|uniref:Outer membrane efflux protein n=1 Tax=Fibrella aestuarina BUZ 2 TaxID=1166018 RepID=I0KHM5_9BACT|nr:TolC family protein [Fibrella aestuarina]CCH03628.1 outer membrane efflux protein [Fibrella aestuarina BUZ 2]